MALRKILALVCIFTLMMMPASSDATFLAVSENCDSDGQPCGYGTSCCPNGFKCSFSRAIPICTNPNQTSISGFDYTPCADPYTIRCDELLGINIGACCPIGSMCRTQASSQIVECINEFGETHSPIPSATTGFVPASTAVTNDAIFYPTHAWTTHPTNYSCTNTKTLYTTSYINATVTIRYTGPSIMINTIISPNGGVFTVNMDGFDTGSGLDTYATPGISRPTCFPVQFPPLVSPPPDFGSRNNHTITLTYIGASSQAPGGIASNIQFESFAVPNHDTTSRLKSSDCVIVTGWVFLPTILLLAIGLSGTV